jgi:hypothetical protein
VILAVCAKVAVVAPKPVEVEEEHGLLAAAAE